MESMKKMSEGAEAKLYVTRIFGAEALVKAREPKAYRQKELDLKLRSIRTRKEARIMHGVKALGVNTAYVLALSEFSIYMTRLHGSLLRDIPIRKTDIEAAGRALALMHKGNIVHGDYTPANLMRCGNDIYVIDFGLSDTTNSVEEKATDLLLMKRSITSKQYMAFESAYAKNGGEHRVIARLAEIEKRGRYQNRSLQTI